MNSTSITERELRDAYKRAGKLTFWFELIRQDKVLEAATQTLIAQIREKTGNPFFFGEPFAQQ